MWVLTSHVTPSLPTKGSKEHHEVSTTSTIERSENVTSFYVFITFLIFFQWWKNLLSMAIMWSHRRLTPKFRCRINHQDFHWFVIDVTGHTSVLTEPLLRNLPFTVIEVQKFGLLLSSTVKGGVSFGRWPGKSMNFVNINKTFRSTISFYVYSKTQNFSFIEFNFRAKTLKDRDTGTR